MSEQQEIIERLTRIEERLDAHLREHEWLKRSLWGVIFTAIGSVVLWGGAWIRDHIHL